MKKSFKRIVAVLLAVMMIVCSFPLTVLAADSNRTNINLQFGDVSNKATPKNYSVERRGATIDEFANYSGLNSTKLEYSNGKIAGYSKGDFFTVSVLVENVSKIAAAEVAIKYSDSISPAYIKSVNSGTAVFEYTESGSAIDGFQPLEAITQQSGDAIYNKTKTLGETSYVDADKKIIHAKFSTQSGSDYADTSSVIAGKQTFTNTAVLATFMFKIVSDEAITFTLDTPDEAYYLETIANGGKVDEYKTYVPKSEGAEAELDFMGKNEYNGSTSTSYTITFNDENGEVLQTGSYEEGTDVIAPALPAVTHDDEKHYTYSWDKTVVSPAAADATYTRVKTGAVHTWDDGVVTKEPTTTETGIKTYTCTFDGCGATKTETLPKKEDAHVHTWGEWKYNGDASYTSSTVYKDGTATRTCTDPNCHETETKTIAGTGLLRARTATADFGGEIKLSVGTRTAQVQQFADVYCKFTREDGKEFIIPSEKSLVSGQNTFFDFGVTPQGLNSDIKITFYGVTEDGITTWGQEYTYNMATGYVLKQLRKPQSTETWKKLLVELMYYGYANQLYANWDTENPLTNLLTDEEKALHETDALTLTKYQNPSYVVCENPVTSWRSMNAEFGSATKLIFRTRAYTPTDDLKAVVTVDGEPNEYVYYYNDKEDKECFVSDGAGGIYFSFPDLSAKRVRSKMYVTLYQGDTAITNTFLYSAETYCLSQANKDPNASQNLTKVTNQLMHYGNAARAYFGVN